MSNYWPYPKDPSERLDYTFDFAASTNGNGDDDVLAAGETIASFVLTVDGETVDTGALPFMSGTTQVVVDEADTAASATQVVVWFDGGTHGNAVEVTCHITTSDGREYERTRKLSIRQR